MIGVAVYEEVYGEDGIYLKTKGVEFTPVVMDSDTSGVINERAETVSSEETDIVKTFLWKYPYMTDFKTNAEQGTNTLPNEEYAYINDGNIKISGTLGSDASGEVTLLMVPADTDMMDAETWKNAVPAHADSQIVYGNGIALPFHAEIQAAVRHGNRDILRGVGRLRIYRRITLGVSVIAGDAYQRKVVKGQAFPKRGGDGDRIALSEISLWQL